MIGVADTAEIVRIKERGLVAAARGNIVLSSEDVVDIGRYSSTSAQDAELAERIAREDEAHRAPAPVCRIIEPLESLVTADLASLALAPGCAVIGLVRGTVNGIGLGRSAAVTTNLAGCIGHLICRHMDIQALSSDAIP